MRYAQYANETPNDGSEGDLLVWHVSNKLSMYLPVESLDDAKLALHVIAQRDLWFNAVRYGRTELIDWNMQGLMVFEDGEWIEWHNDFGMDIHEVVEAGAA